MKNATPISSGVDLRDKFQAGNGQYVALVSGNGNNLLLLQAKHDTFELPTVDVDPHSPHGASEQYRDAVCHLFGIDKLGTHVVDEHFFRQYPLNDIGIGVVLRIIEVTSDEVTINPPLSWIDWKLHSALSSPPAEHPAVLQYLKSFLESLGSPISTNRQLPWYRLGYFGEIRPLLTERLKALGYEIEGELEQVNFSFHSSTYRIPSKSGNLFLKSCPTGSDETTITKAMHDLFPDDVAPLVRIVPKLNAVVTQDVSPILSALICGLHEFEKSEERAHTETLLDLAMKQWASFQQKSSSLIVELKAAGIPVYDGDWIKTGFQQVVTYAGDHQAVSPEALASLKECEKEIQATLALWEASGIPETIVHGDLSEDNVGKPDGQENSFVWFDLESVCLAYPFFDLLDPLCSMLMLSEIKYLQCWETYADMDTINELARRTKQVRYVMDAVLIVRNPVLSTDFIKSELSVFIRDIIHSADCFS